MLTELNKLLAGHSLVLFGMSIASSMLSGLMTMSAFVLLFRSLRVDEAQADTWWEFAALAAAALATRGLAGVLLGHITRESIMEMRIRLAHGVASAPLIAIERIGSTRLFSTLTGDMTTVAFALPNLVRLGANAGFVLACLGFLGWLSPKGLGMLLIVIAAGLLGSYLLRREGLKHMRVSRQRWDELVQCFRTLVDGAKELRLDAERRTRALHAYEANVRAVRDSTRNQFVFISGASGGMQFFLFAALGVMVAGSDMHIVADRELLISFSILLIYMIGPLRSINDAFRALSEAEAALVRVQKLGIQLDALRFRRARLPAPRAADIGENWRQLELRSVTHSYRSEPGTEEFTLGPVNLAFARGEIVFIVGGNGSGKTTLAKLLTGLYLPRSGEIRIDGHLVTPAAGEWYRRQFAAIFSDFFVFEDLVGQDNGQAIEQRAEQVLARFKISHKVQIKDCALSPAVLSVGERKRLALALACLQDRPVYVLDEWGAEQDPAFKDVFYREILAELRADGKLVVVISHDDRYFDVADKIVFLERGAAPVLRDTQYQPASAPHDGASALRSGTGESVPVVHSS
jgi:putative pyoverdin transport system ATP-binding/permease protein